MERKAEWVTEKMINSVAKNLIPQIKICGLTESKEARACVELGADAIGLVFYPPSPRYVTIGQARTIAAQLPDGVPAVGVFNNAALEDIVRAVSICGLGGIQLHGSESPVFIDQLRREFRGTVIKGLFLTRAPFLSQACQFNATAYLVEYGKGPLPGGNALAWDWINAAEFSRCHPTVLAGGLTPDNVQAAIGACLPDAVDASSGLESAPGRKDLEKVARFIANVRQTYAAYQTGSKTPQPLFRGSAHP